MPIDFHALYRKIHFDILQGFNFRPLYRTSSVSREQFLSECHTMISMAEEMAEGGAEARREARNMAIRRIAENSLFFFCVFVLKMDFVNHDFGYRLCNDVQYNKWNGKLWVIARDHFKTTIITQASTLWELMKDPERTYIIISYNKEFSEKCVSTIKTWCEDCVLLYELWPNVFWKDPAACHQTNDDGSETVWTWTKTSIELKRKRKSKEKSVDSGSIKGSAGTGGHWTHLIYDDAETPETVETADAISKAYAGIIMSFNTGVTSYFNYCFVGTFYAKDDVYVRLIKNGQIKESVIQPCVEIDERGKLRGICYTAEQLETKITTLNSTDAAITQMFCDPSVSNNTSLDPAWIMRWNPSASGLNVYIIVDPAGNKQKRQNDFTVMWVVGLDALGNLKCLDIVRDKLNATTKFATLCGLYSAYRPIRVYYEQESMQADVDLMRRFMDEYNIHFPIIPYSMKRYGSKLERMDQLQMPFEMGRIWLPYHTVHTNYQGRQEDMIESFIREEYLGYPLIQHDDAMDALATAWILLNSKQLTAPAERLPFADRFSITDSRRRGDDEEYDSYDSMV